MIRPYWFFIFFLGGNLTFNDTEAPTSRISTRGVIRISILITVVGLTIALFFLRDQVQELDDLGYLGAFLVMLLSSATILVPVPGIAVIFVLGDIWNPLYIGLVSGLGSALGELTGYYAGYSGQNLFQNNKFYSRISSWMEKWQGLWIFLFALIPNPLFDIVGMVAGIMRYKVWKFLFVCFLGKTARSIFIAYAGQWGLEWVRSWFAN